jgi:hypothetical protein
MKVEKTEFRPPPSSGGLPCHRLVVTVAINQTNGRLASTSDHGHHCTHHRDSHGY